MWESPEQTVDVYGGGTVAARVIKVVGYFRGRDSKLIITFSSTLGDGKGASDPVGEVAFLQNRSCGPGRVP